jgi:hypothetical protein
MPQQLLCESAAGGCMGQQRGLGRLLGIAAAAAVRSIAPAAADLTRKEFRISLLLLLLLKGS